MKKNVREGGKGRRIRNGWGWVKGEVMWRGESSPDKCELTDFLRLKTRRFRYIVAPNYGFFVVSGNR